MIDDIVYDEVQYFEMKMEDENYFPNLIIFGSYDSTDIELIESISIF